MERGKCGKDIGASPPETRPWAYSLPFISYLNISHPKDSLTYTRGEQGLVSITVGSKSTGQTEWNILDATLPQLELTEFPGGTILPCSPQLLFPAQGFA